MAKYKSKNSDINASCETVYNFMANFNNFEKLMPSQVKNWKSDGETCSFTIESLSELSMKINNKVPNKSINIISYGKNPVDYTLDCFFWPVGKDKCEVEIIFNADLNAFIKMVADKPLQNFVNMLADKLGEQFE
ncbi:MAG: hypothetical protein ACOCWC_01065 [Bacteroidota bacterium]